MEKQKSEEKKPIIEEISLPDGTEANLDGTILKIKGQKGELTRDFYYPSINISLEGKKITLKSETHRKQEKAITSSFKAHVLNMIKGVTEGFKYNLKIVYSHFPITVKVSPDNYIEISNFLGEKLPRRAKIFGNVKVNVQKDEIFIEGTNIEEVAQTAANVEQATKIKKRDPRVFQDGIYMVKSK